MIRAGQSYSLPRDLSEAEVPDVTAATATGKGVAEAMWAQVWQHFGFETLARLSEAFSHPRLGLVDALLMRRSLDH